MAGIIVIVAQPPRGGATSKSTWWAFEVKLWGTLGVNTHLTRASMGKFLEMTLYHSMRLVWFSSWPKLQLEDGRLGLPLVTSPQDDQL
jgi:hypothetical protein